MKSIKELYKIGNGPSSSHTMGPKKAALLLKEKYPTADLYQIILYGSLAFTGKGHLTDKIILEALKPSNVEIIFNKEIKEIKHPNTMDLIALKNKEEVLKNGYDDSTTRYTQIGVSAFNENFNDNAYVGYMYGTPGSSTYEQTHANINDSTIKTYIDNWYAAGYVKKNV